MKTKKMYLAAGLTAVAIIITAVVLFTVVGTDRAKQSPDSPSMAWDPVPDVPVDTAALQAQVDSVAADTAQPFARPPVLKIGGRENPDVYLQSLDIQVEVTGSVASTRYTMVFMNRTGRDLEGELTFPLPDGVTVTHHALDIDGRMRDAVPVEKARATQAFEEIQQRELVIDPSILERVEGNNFRTRIYPFPRYGTRTVTVGYEEELTLDGELLYYRLPMSHADPLEKFSVTATVWNSDRRPVVSRSEEIMRFDREGLNYIASFERRNFRPDRALVFALPALAGIPQVIMQPAEDSYYFMASVVPNMEPRAKKWSKDLAVIWDVSLSGSQRDLDRETGVLDMIFAQRKDADVHLYFLNNKLNKIVGQNARDGAFAVRGGDWSGLKNALNTAVFDGGTDYSQIGLSDILGDEILLFSDGISTLSGADFVKDADADRQIHCVVSSPQADYGAMKTVANKTGGKYLNLNALSPEQLRRELLNESIMFLGAEYGKPLRHVYPGVAAPVLGNFSISGICDGTSGEMTLLFGFGNKIERRIGVKLNAETAGHQGNARRIWAQKKIAELDLNFNAHKEELTRLGNQFGIVTRNTSLIVLDLIDDYVLFNIEPPATEPELLAEYRRRVRDKRESEGPSWADREVNMLRGAVAAARDIREWWVNPILRLPRSDKDGDGSFERLARVLRFPGFDNRVEVATDFFEKLPEERVAKMVTNEERVARIVTNVDFDDYKTEEAAPAPSKSLGSQSPGPGFGAAMGGGDPRARITQNGVLGIVSGQIKGNAVVPSEVFGSGGFAADIDAILSGTGGLQSGGSGSSSGRRGMSGIGYGSGYGSGFSAGVDDLLGGLMGSGGDNLNLKKRGELKVSSPDFLRGGALTGGRSRASIQRVVMQNMAALRHAYNRRLRDKPHLVGRITVKFAIDEFGDVRFVQMVESTMSDSELENTVMQRVRSWKFERIDRPGDITEVTYPFVFSNGGGTAAALSPEALERNRVLDSIARETARVRDSITRVRQRIFEERGGKAHLLSLTEDLAEDYRIYLMLRDHYSNSPTFYFDMADWFYRRGDRETALRILTSIAELQLENASLYRMLGYRLKEYGEHELQKFVFQKVLQWRPIEPQSYRDYALALADNGEEQAALDSLYGMLTRSYPANIVGRSPGIEEVVIMEMNRLIAKNPKLKTRRINKRLIARTPVDVRVVLNWNLNNVDIDMRINCPNAERRYSGNNRDGYGPEQIVLKNAAKGKYEIMVEYQTARDFADQGPVTVMVEIYTKYSDRTEQRRVVCAQLSRAYNRYSIGNTARIAEFEL